MATTINSFAELKVFLSDVFGVGQDVLVQDGILYPQCSVKLNGNVVIDAAKEYQTVTSAIVSSLSLIHI